MDGEFNENPIHDKGMRNSIKIPIRFAELDAKEATNLELNVSEYLSNYMQKPKDTRQKLDKLICDIDKKVHINTSDPRYKPIYNGIDVIMSRICDVLEKEYPRFAGIKRHLCGSVSSDTKVGLPHEADYLLEIPVTMTKDEVNKFLAHDLSDIRGNLVSKADWLRHDLPGWTIHAIKKHIRLPGACLIMEYKDVNGTVGVTVDVIFANKVNKEETEAFTPEAEQYLGNDLHHYIQKGIVHRLLDYLQQVDTGMIENEIMRDLPEGKKRGFRVAKYMLQYLIRTDWQPIDDYDMLYVDPKQLTESQSIRLFGYKPLIKSYRLRVLFLHLLIATRGTEAEKQLEDGALTMCLLTMMRHVCAFHGQVYIAHPLVKGLGDICMRYDSGLEQQLLSDLLDKILNDVSCDGPFACLDNYSLLNSENDPLRNSIWKGYW